MRASVDTYSFRPETPTLIHHLEEVLIGLASEEIQPRNFEITPEMTHVVFFVLHGFRIHIRELSAIRVQLQHLLREFIEFGLLWLLFRLLKEHLPHSLRREIIGSFICRCVAKQIGYGFLQFLDRNRETVGFVVPRHVSEGVAESVSVRATKRSDGEEAILCDVTEIFDLGLQAPIPFVFRQQFVFVEKSGRVAPVSKSLFANTKNRSEEGSVPRIEATHVMVAGHATVHDCRITLLCN